VGESVRVPIGIYSLMVKSLPARYQCYGAYGTGNVSISDWTVIVNGDGGIVLKLTTVPPAKPSLWLIIPVIAGAAIFALASARRRRRD